MERRGLFGKLTVGVSDRMISRKKQKGVNHVSIDLDKASVRGFIVLGGVGVYDASCVLYAGVSIIAG